MFEARLKDSSTEIPARAQLNKTKDKLKERAVKIRSWYVVTRFLLAGIAVPALAQTPPAIQPQTPPRMMPYTAIFDPHFVPASVSGFLQEGDTVVGVSRGKLARAFPAADLAQHGVVLAQMPDGPIAVTW